MTTTATMSKSPHPEQPTWRQILGVVDATLELVAHTANNVERLVRDVRKDAVEIANASTSFAESAQQGWESVAETWRATPRFTRTLTTGLRVLASYQLHQRKALFISEDSAHAALQSLHLRNAQRVHDLCVELGGGILKLGQFLSCRADILPEPYVQILAALQDRVPPEPFDEALIAHIEAELGAPLDTLFTHFDTEAIAAASLAQVHAATLPSGVRVAVKVQRPGIAERVEADIAAMRFLTPLFGEHFKIDLSNVIKALTVNLRAELDFNQEAEHTRAFAERHKDRADLIIPGIHPELSSERVLTLEHIAGRRLTDALDDPETTPEARDALFSTLIEVFCIQILVHGHFHADPHPGNFMAADDGRLVLLDFGAVGELDQTTRDAYIALISAGAFGDHEAMLEPLRVLGFATRPGHEGALLEMADMILATFSAGATLDTIDIDPREQLERALEIIYAHPGFEVPESFVLLGRVLAALGGLVLRYRPRVNLMMLMLPHLQ